MVKSSYDAARRAELAAFLRSRREGIRPHEVGLAAGPRRRTPGLRREEVAQLAGVGVTWYTWLEQGRPINASTQVLDALVRVLRLGSAERWHLYRLADVPGVPNSRSGPLSVPAEVLPVLDALDPNPACVYDGKYDLLACNEAYAALFPALARADGAERNALWQMVVAARDGAPICGWELVPPMVAIARGNYARHVGEPEWTEWIERLGALSPEFAALWAEHRVADAVPTVKAFRCGDVGMVQARTTSFAVHGAPECRMIVYLPLSAADVAKIEVLRARLPAA